MAEFYIKHKVIETLLKYNIKFEQYQDRFEIESQDLTIIPSKKIVKMLGLKNNKGNETLIDSLNKIRPEWLLTFYSYHYHYFVYNEEGNVNITNLHEFLLVIRENMV